MLQKAKIYFRRVHAIGVEREDSMEHVDSGLDRSCRATRQQSVLLGQHARTSCALRCCLFPRYG